MSAVLPQSSIESKIFKSCKARENSSLSCGYRLGSGKEYPVLVKSN